MTLKTFTLALLLSNLLITQVLSSDGEWSWGKDEDKSTGATPSTSEGFVRIPNKASSKSIASSVEPIETKKKTPALPEGRTFGFFKKLGCKFGRCDDDNDHIPRYPGRYPVIPGPGPVYPVYPGGIPFGPAPVPIPIGPPPIIGSLPPIVGPIGGLPIHGSGGYPPIQKPHTTNTQLHHHSHTHIHEGNNGIHGVSPYKNTGYPPKTSPVGYPPIKSPVGYPPIKSPVGYPPIKSPVGYPPIKSPVGYPPGTSGFAPTVIGGRPTNFNSGESLRPHNAGHRPHNLGHNNGVFGIPPLTGHPEAVTNPLYRPTNSLYGSACDCVFPHQCNPHDIVSKSLNKDISYLINPRSEAVSILSNDTSSRSKRDTFITNRQPVGVSSSTASQRAIGGFPPGLRGCGHNYVCCRNSHPNPPHRISNVCGKSFKSSIHGRIANPDYTRGTTQFGQYPWQAAILKDDSVNYNNIFVCGGTLVSFQHVLTAAHCIVDEADYYLKVRLGEWDVNSETEFYQHIELPIQNAVIHPEYYAGNLNNDIAVITLKSYLDLQSYPHISPVCLPNPHADFTHQQCVVTGWGKDAFGYTGDFQQILKEVDVPVVDRQSCQYALQEARLGRDYYLPDGFICAGGEEGKDSCKGDGGGPLVCPNGYGDYELAGIVSWGIECGIRGIPGVYVNIPYYVDWIKKIIGY